MSESLRRKVVDSAIMAGKFPESRRDHYYRLWEGDPTGTAALIAQLAPGVTTAANATHPAVYASPYASAAPHASSAPSAPAADAEYISAHLTVAERDRIQAARQGRQHSRVVQEQ